MEKNHSFYTIGELARRAGVSVRTLQYYDRTGLLKSELSESGRRLYTRNDVIKLQQILFLKSFGFSLEEIERKILPSKSARDLEGVFAEQRNILTGQVEQLQKITGLLDTMIEEIRSEQEVSLEKLVTMLELMKQGNPYSFMLRYFSSEQLANVSKRYSSSQDTKEFLDTAKNIFSRMNDLYKEGADPAGEEAQELAKSWWKMVETFSGGDTELVKTLISAGVDIENWPKETRDFSDAIKNFLGKALDIYLKNNRILLPGKENGHE